MPSRSQLKNLSPLAARDLYSLGKLSRFELRMRDFVNGQMSLPVYAPADVRRLRKELGLSQSTMASLFGVQDKTVLRWERDGENIPGPACVMLCLLDKCRDSFFELLNPNRKRLHFAMRPQKGKQQASDNDDTNATALGTSQDPFDATKLENRRRDMPETFDGPAIRHLRERLDISREDLADMLDVSLSSVIKWETGYVTPKGPTLILLKSLWLHGFDALPE